MKKMWTVYATRPRSDRPFNVSRHGNLLGAFWRMSTTMRFYWGLGSFRLHRNGFTYTPDDRGPYAPETLQIRWTITRR